jgi:antibiotic biosynthesis monooxygenase (ABM) superfamily enzyme
MKFSQHLATNILLASILVVLVLIWYRMPAITDTFNVEVRNRLLFR